MQTRAHGSLLYISLAALRSRSRSASFSIEEGERIVKDIEGDFVQSVLAYLRLWWERGLRALDEGGKAGLSNGLREEWDPKTVDEGLKELTGGL